jgi:hypothetical protein
VIVLLLGLVGGTTSIGATTSVSTGSIRGEDAQAAALRWSDVKRFLPAGGAILWPELPQFNTGLESGPKSIAEAVEQFDYVGPDAQRAGAQLVSTVIVHPTSVSAKTDYSLIERTSDAGGTTLSGPAVPADQWRFFEKPAGKLVERTLRWRIGAAVGRITAIDNSGYSAANWTPARLAGLFAPVASRVHALLAGRLHAVPLPPSAARVLPPPTAAPGAVLGTALAPAEGWAAVDSSQQPQVILRQLRAGGAGTLIFRQYAVRGAPGNTVVVTVFPFHSEKAANVWAKAFPGHPTGIKLAALDPGNTGATSAFVSVNGGSYYELQFARAKISVDIGCDAPFAKTSNTCERATRTLAEKWYAALPQH